MGDTEFDALRNLIAEHTKTERTSKHIDYIDFKNNLSSASTNTSTVIYGRRGSGKTTLLMKLKEKLADKSFTVYINCEECKDYTYPNTLIFLLKRVFTELKQDKRFGFLKRNNEIDKLITELNLAMGTSDIKTVKKTKEKSEHDGASATISGGVVGARGGRGHECRETESSREEKKKIDDLLHSIGRFKDTIEKILSKSKKESVFLLLDDFYFVRRKDQPRVIDYIHRLCKDSNVCFKLATVKHRSSLYYRSDREIVGIQEGAEFQPIDLDCTLENIGKTKTFLHRMLGNIVNRANMNVENLFIAGDNGFPRLVWASGGVPRDMLNIFNYCMDDVVGGKIGKKEVNAAAKKFFQDKLKEMDSEYMIKRRVPDLFQKIWSFCIEYQSKTAFLIKGGQANGKMDAFNELVDLRFIHLARTGVTTKKRPAESYEAYILDIGSYSDQLSLTRKKIKEINLLKEYSRKGDSEFRSVTPVLDLGRVDDITSRPKPIASGNQRKRKKAHSESPAQQRLAHFFNKFKETTDSIQ